MRHIIYGKDAGQASVAILIKEAAFDTNKIKQAYINEIGANPAAFIACSLWYNDKNKCPADMAKDYLKNVLHSIKQLNIKKILIADSHYFKYLTKQVKPASAFLGCKVKSQIEDYENEFEVFYTPNYQAMNYNPKIKHEIEIALNYFKKFLSGTYIEPGKDIIHSAKHLHTPEEIQQELYWLLQKPELQVDIESKGLEFWNCGIASISFSWDKHNYVSFTVDRGFFIASPNEKFSTTFGTVIKKKLRQFFDQYTGKLVAHNAGFDFKVLTYELWMKDLQDYPGMLQGIQTLTRSFDDTKIITYLATNNAVENVLKLKALSIEFTGNYAEDVTDTNKIPVEKLLKYNGIDCLATCYVKEKYYPIMVKEGQKDIYESLFKPSIITLLQTELVGMPIFHERVIEVKRILTAMQQKYKTTLENSSIIKEFQLDVQAQKCRQFTEEAKKKVFTMDDPKVQRLVFNPNSNQQVANLLFNYLGLPVLDLTEGNSPAVGGDTLTKLLNHTSVPMYLSILKALIGLAKVEKILTSFIPAFENAVKQPDGNYKLYGNFNLGGTVSGRLSSSHPNLQNLPSGSTFGKLIKSCFGSSSTWLFGGADFNSLEDRISALTTRDPNKMKVYLDGYDGHSLRAFSYFRDQMLDILDSVNSINSIKHKYPKLRQASKGPTFALTYQGTSHTLVNNLGLDKATAMQIEENYHKLYAVSDQWVADKLQQACIDGFVTGAFGLKLRTPILKMNGPGKLNYKAAAEGRTAGNMLGQSYGMLNSRAANELRERIWNSPYKYDILPVGQIHDALYFIWRNKLGVTKWLNDNIIDCMEWCGLVELQHPTIKLGAELDIFYPNWAIATTLKNNSLKKEIYQQCKQSPEIQ